MKNDLGLMAIESGLSMALRGVDVSVRIAGLLAETTLTQKYRNDGKDNVELTYTFPLPVDGVLLAFAVQLGERRYQGEVIPRKKAEVDYESAIAEGNAAFRLQKIGDGLYNATLGNVMAGESITFTLTYAQVLVWNGRNIRYRLPTTMAPRYGDPSGLQPWQHQVTSLDAEYPLSLVLRVDGPLAKSAIACPSHKVKFQPADDSLTITLGTGANMDRDFILEIVSESVQSLGLQASARATHVAVLTLLPPAVEPDASNARDIVIVLDCSGSMMGDSIALAKEGVQLGLGSLSPNERFAVMGFGSEFAHFDPALQPANRKNIDLARKFVRGLGNLGGTELSQALELALAYVDDHPMDILLLTDGQSQKRNQAIAKATEKGIRIFTVGIGSAVAEDTVRALAEQTGGACELVSPNEDMSARIFRHFNRMRQPQMTLLDIHWPSEPIWESRPETGCFAGDAYTVMAAFAAPISAPVQIGFAFAGSPAVRQSVPLAPAAEVSDTIVRIAAKAHLAQLPVAEQTDWSLRYQLVTRETDYLITVERAADEKATSLPALQVVPHMLPAGWGGTSTVHDTSAVLFSVRRSRAYALEPLAGVPPMLRMAGSDDVRQALGIEDPYEAFLNRLNARASRKFFGSLPKTKKGLARLEPPQELKILFDDLASEAYPEKEIIRALYQALIEHDGLERLGAPLVAKAKAFIGSSAREDVVTRFRVLLNRLWANRGLAPSPLFDRYDVPAFLKRQPDKSWRVSRWL